MCILFKDHPKDCLPLQLHSDILLTSKVHMHAGPGVYNKCTFGYSYIIKHHHQEYVFVYLDTGCMCVYIGG